MFLLKTSLIKDHGIEDYDLVCDNYGEISITYLQAHFANLIVTI